MRQRLLVELDMLLDTRIATVLLMNPTAALELLSPAYRNRRSDELGELTKHITTEDFEKAYAQRSVETLRVARATPMALMFGRVVRDLLKELTNTPRFDGVDVEVNVWPYQLSEQERVDIVTCVMAHINFPIQVKAVSIHPNELTFKRIDAEQWTAIFLYNFRQWAEYHVERYSETDPSLASRSMIIPELLKTVKEELPKEDTKAPSGEALTPFNALRMMMSPIIAIQYVPVEMVSILEIPEVGIEPPGS